MKKFLRTLCFGIGTITATYSNAQCGAGYTQAQLNWDRLDYYYNSGSNVAPYGFSTPSNGNYITNAMEQTQRFAIGRNYVTITTPAAGVVDGENATHTGEVAANYLGEDAQFTPSASGQSITLTFNAEVQNLKFTLYDVDASQRIDFGAVNAASTAQNINVVTYAGSILTISNNNATNARITATSTSLGNSVNTGTATITVSGSVKTFTLSFNTIGTDPTFWLSDINACVFGSFPNNYNQTPDNRPLQGPAGNQPDYFLVTPDNNSVYMVDPATSNAWKVFNDPAKTYVNSFAYDPYHHYLYYITENVAVNSSNHELKRYDFSTGSFSTLVADITATLGIPTMGSGVESAGACFYDGALYIGIEGGRYSTSSTRETIFWRIELDASQNPILAYQVFASDAYNGSTSIHDFGDFIIKNGVLYDFNTARNGSNYSESKYQQVDLTTGSMSTYNNPGTVAWNGQAGMTWTGDLYYFRGTTSGNSGIGYYNGTGTNNAPVDITVVDGSGAWVGGAGDASENFRPAVDFGDAPSSYDPNPLSPAAHAQDAKLKLGSNEDKEWITRGQSAPANSDNYDDGIGFVQVLDPNAGTYLAQLSVFNNTGASATVCAWLDYNGNGVFDASEGITSTVSSSPSAQLIWLFWPSISTSIPLGGSTYLRVRVTSAAMTTSMPTGYFSNGEVEDYQVQVNSWGVLAVQNSDFNARLNNTNSAKLTWSSTDESNISFYSIEKSTNNSDWSPLKFVSTQIKSGPVNYEVIDGNISDDITYYRLKTTQKNSQVTLSAIKQINNRVNKFSIFITPNPVVSKATVTISSAFAEKARLQVVNSAGIIVYNQTINIKKGTNSFELPVSTFMNGTYIVNLSAGSQSVRQSLIINN
jgi:hypothetical protein